MLTQHLWRSCVPLLEALKDSNQLQDFEKQSLEKRLIGAPEESREMIEKLEATKGRCQRLTTRPQHKIVPPPLRVEITHEQLNNNENPARAKNHGRGEHIHNQTQQNTQTNNHQHTQPPTNTNHASQIAEATQSHRPNNTYHAQNANTQTHTHTRASAQQKHATPTTPHHNTNTHKLANTHKCTTKGSNHKRTTPTTPK